MVDYIPAYEVFVEYIHSEQWYQTASPEKKQQYDAWFENPLFKNNFKDLFVPQLDFAESMAFALLNSQAFKDCSQNEQSKIMDNLDKFMRKASRLEKLLK
jgi:hypothetical protein